MSNFEVHIPGTDGNGFHVTLKVGADNWMAALKAGLQKLGEQGTISQNVMVDIQADNSIHVTEAASGRVFRIRELTEEEAARAQVKRPSQIRPPPPPRSDAKTDPAAPADMAKTLAPADTAKTVLATDTAKTVLVPPTDLAKTVVPTGDTESPDTAKTLPPPAAVVAPPAAPSPTHRPRKSSARVELKDVEELVSPLKPATGNIGRAKSTPDVLKSQRQVTEDILADIFLRVVELGSMKDITKAMEFVLDLVLEKVPCEAGSVLRADGATGDLSFLAVRGPKADEIRRSNIIIPAGTGIAGFCASEGVSVAVSDVEKDPRFYAEVGARVGYATRSMLCAPMMTHGTSFGCVQVINRKGGPQFLEHEVGVLAYLAHQAALFLNLKLLE